jgi:hypothetical protein
MRHIPGLPGGSTSFRTDEILTIKAKGIYGHDPEEEVEYKLSHNETCSMFGIEDLDITYIVQLKDNGNKLFVDETYVRSDESTSEARRTTIYNSSTAVYVEVSNTRFVRQDDTNTEGQAPGGHQP